ncbi:hypothetical protein DB346_24130 [Verrucomicrobia bacterium LW23]|nr:hypothetical protein DB346_24130 [Verrucomicrobia bacterium LW23]
MAKLTFAISDMLTRFWMQNSLSRPLMPRLAHLSAFAALLVAAAMVCAATSLRAQTNAAPEPSPGPTASAAEQQDLVRRWFSAAATLDFPTLAGLSDKAAADKFRLLSTSAPDLAKVRATNEFQELKKRVDALIPEVLVIGDVSGPSENQASIPVTLKEDKLSQWVELRELISAYVQEYTLAKEANRTAQSLDDLARRAKDRDPNYDRNLKDSVENLLEQNRQAPRAWLALEQGSWKVNLTRMEKESREAAGAAAAK